MVSSTLYKNLNNILLKTFNCYLIVLNLVAYLKERYVIKMRQII